MKSNSDLYKYLTYYLLTVPKLFDELPQILSSLDSGEIIMTSNIQDIGLRDAIDHIFRFLPAIQTRDGWIREKTVSVIGHVFSKLLEDNVIKQPSSLSLSEIQASRSAPLHLMKMAQTFPDIINDVNTILETLLGENAIDISNLENEDVSEFLVSLLASLGIKEGEEGYKLSSASEFETVTHFKRIFDTISSLQSNTDANKSSKSKVDANIDSSSNSSSSSSSSDDSDNEKNRKRKAAVSIGPSIGPAKPSHLNIQSVKDYKTNVIDDDNEDVGPSLDDFNTSKLIKSTIAVSTLACDPIGGKIETTNYEEYNSEANNNQNANLEREEWMLTIGENKTLADLGAAIVTNRQFQRGREADKIAKKLAQSKVKEIVDPVEEERLRKIEEEDRQRRGKSLMELHLDKKNSEKASGKREKPKAFDREKDFVVTHKMVNSIQVKQIVSEAKKLDNRFSRSS